MRALIKFTKENEIKFVSHLDLMRALQRALVRAQLPVSYSQGFSPHMLMSIACALPTGAASHAEYAEIWFDEDIAEQQIFMRLFACMPQAMRLLFVKCLPEQTTGIAAAVCSADYDITLPVGQEDIAKSIAAAVGGQESIIINKRTKKGVKPTEIRPMIEQISAQGNVLKVRLAAGNSVNLRPDVLMQYINESVSAAEDYSIVRQELYMLNGTEKTPVCDIVEAQ